MTTSVVTVDRITPYKEIARLLTEHRISGLPVLKMGREVAGVVTEADLLAAQAGTARRLHASVTRSWWPHRQEHSALTAGELMTTPAITVGPHVTIPAAARLMNTHRIRRLPASTTRAGLSASSAAATCERVPAAGRGHQGGHPSGTRRDPRRRAGKADVTLRNGIVTLTGSLDPRWARTVTSFRSPSG